MKRLPLVLLPAILLAAPVFAQVSPGDPAAQPPQTLKDRASYSIGVKIAQDLKAQKLDLTPMMLAAGSSTR